MKIKVCGMREPQNIRAVEALPIDWMGFIFYPHSPRYVAAVPRFLPLTVRRVGVFVNADDATIERLARDFGLQTLQFHGTESPERCRQWGDLGYETIRALPVGSADDFARAADYDGACDYLLFDTRCTQHGGSGRRFDWSLIDTYDGRTPFLLSGGLRPESVEAVKAISHPQFAGIDLNSGFETAPALKDVAALKTFIDKLKNQYYE